jgi:transposase-like protein
MARAYLSGAYTMAEIGDHFGVHYMTVSRAVRRFGHYPLGAVCGNMLLRKKIDWFN